MSRAPRFNAATLPPEIADRLDAQTRKGFGVESTGERNERLDSETERDLQRLCENYLRQHEVEFLHLSSRAREKEGWPDLVFPLNGQFVAVELKTASGQLSDAQKKTLNRLATNGASCHVVRRFEDFRQIVGTPDGLNHEPTKWRMNG